MIWLYWNKLAKNKFPKSVGIMYHLIISVNIGYFKGILFFFAPSYHYGNSDWTEKFTQKEIEIKKNCDVLCNSSSKFLKKIKKGIDRGYRF